MTSPKKTRQPIKNGRVLLKDTCHPFSDYPTSTQLNPEAYIRIDGANAYVEFSWRTDGSNYEEDNSAGPAEDIHNGNIELYENDDSITVRSLTDCKGYRYPKEYFELVKDTQFDWLLLRDQYPKEQYDLIKESKLNPRQ